MARPIEVPVVVKKGSLARSIEGETTTAMRKLGSSSTAVAPLGRMLGKIRADADEFTKSIEASNARVIAFGASVGVINGISNAFKSLVATTVKVEKSMADINIVLGASQKNLAKFGDGLFKVAKNTAQSFEVVAEAATEFARQGLSIEETLSRTNDALILTRLTGLKAAESVKGLTAAVNGFGKAGLTTTQIINKLSAVDVKFAVGTDDLINALSRAGAVAQDAGVSFDELVALVTVAQQRTARGGAVIGNAFKTIYTRIQDPKALNALRSVKIAVDDVNGAALPANKILQNLASTYDTLGRSQKATVDQFVAGKFQINILKSVLGDLSSANNDYTGALRTSLGATDQAIQKNQELNKTLAALATQGGIAVEELAKKVGDISLGPGMRNILTTFNELVESMTRGLDGEGAGSTFAKGLLKGIGGILTGPGLILIGGVFLKLFKDLTVFGVKSMKNLLGLNNASKQQAALQQGISQLLATNLKFQAQIAAAEGNKAKQAAITQRFLAQEVTLRERAAAATSRMAAGAYAGGFGVSAAGAITRGRSRRVPGFAPTGSGVPNFMMLKNLGAFMNKHGMKGAMGRVNVAEGSAREAIIGRSLGMQGGLGSSISISDISTKGKGRIAPGPDFPGGDVKPGMIHPGGSSDIAKRSGSGFGPGQATRAASQGGVHYSGYESFPSGHGTGPLHYGQKYFSSSSRFGKVVQGINPFEAGTAKHAGVAGAIERVRASGLPERGHLTGIPANFSDSNLRKEFYTRVARHAGIRPRFTRKGNDFDMEPAQDILNHLGSLSKAQVQKIMTGAANAERLAAGARGGIPNYAPIGDAIRREKMQVGGMMGISPSSVKTRVIQNTALKTDFNPQGYGVISPTVGQNSFADAQRMHRGEHLPTTNLPNFANGLGGNPYGSGASITPVGYSGETTKVVVEDFSDKASKKAAASTESALEKRSRADRGTRFAGMTTTVGEVAKPPGALTRGYRSLRSGMGALGTGLQGAGGRAMGPAFTAMMLGEMAQGFVPAPATQDRLTMSGAQRRQAGASAKGVDYATKAATGLTALAAATPPITPHSALIKGGLVLAGTAASYMAGREVGGDATLNIDERGALVEKRQQQRQNDQSLGDAARQSLVMAAQQRGNPSQYKSTLTKGREALRDIQDPKLKSDLTKSFNEAESTGLLAAGVRKMGEAQTTHAPRIGAGVASARGGQALATIATHDTLTQDQMEHVASAIAGLSESEITTVDQFLRGTSVNMPELLGMGVSKEGQAELFNQLKDKGFLKGGIRHPETGKGTSPLGKMVMQYRAPSTALGPVGGDPGINRQSEFDAMRLRLLQSRGANARFQATEAGAARVRGIAQGARLDIRGRIGGASATAQTRYLDALNEQSLGAANAQRGLAADMAGTFGALPIDANPRNEAFMKAMTDALAGGDLGAARKTMGDVKFGEGGRISFQGKDLDIMDNNKNLEKFAENLENSAKLLDINSQAQLNYIEAQKKTADIMQKNGMLIAGIEGFRNSVQEALMSIADPSLSGGDIGRNFAMGILGSINQKASANVADYLGGKLGNFFGIDNQQGGLIKAQNGMYISGSRTGDKNPAMLEDGEYVLNRNAVKAMGGASALDSINFNMAPRFNTGGLYSGVSSRIKRKARDKFSQDLALFGPTTGGSAVGGGGVSLGLDPLAGNLSSIGVANDPLVQAHRSFFRQERSKEIQKKFQKQAKRDELVQMIVSTAISTGLSAGINKLREPKTPSGGGDSYADALALNAFDPNLGARPHQEGSLGPGYNMIPGASTATMGIPPFLLRQGTPMAPRFTGTPSANRAIAASDRYFNVGQRLGSGMDFTKAVSPLGPSGRSTSHVMDTFRGAGIKGGDRSAMSEFMYNLGLETGSDYGVIPLPKHRGLGIHQTFDGAVREKVDESVFEYLSTDSPLFDPTRQMRGPNVKDMNDRLFREKYKDLFMPPKQRGGSIDHIPAMLTGGEFVVNAGAVRKYGSSTLQRMNRGGLVGGQQFVPAENGGAGGKKEQGATTSTNNNTVSINVNMGSGGAGATVTEDSTGTNEMSANDNRNLGRRIRSAVLEVIENEKRVSGSMRDPYKRDQ